MKSVIARKRGNLTAAAEYLDSACTILESIPNINVALFPFSSLDQQDHRMSLRTHLPPSAQRRSRPRAASQILPLREAFLPQRRLGLHQSSLVGVSPSFSPSSRVEAPELLYINQRVDKLLHVASLFLADPSLAQTELKRLAAEAPPQSFFLSLCNFALNITASCRRCVFSPFFGRVTSSATQPPAARWRDFSRERRFASNMKCCTRWIFSTPWCRFPREGSGRKRSGWRGWSERGFRCGTQGVV